MRTWFIAILLFILSILILGRNLSKPFEGIHDWNGARYGNIARNYLRYGFFTLRFTQIENGGGQVWQNFKFYTHYPPLLPILIAVSFKIFGVNEWATRLIPTFATSGLVVLIYLIGRTMFDERVGFIASLVSLATPSFRYFGKNPVHEPLALFFASISFLGIAKIIKKNDNGWFLVYLGVALTLLTNWSGVFLILALSLILYKKVTKKRLVSLWIVGFILVSLHFFQTYLITGSVLGGDLYEALILRTGVGGGASLTKFSLFEFLDRFRLWASTLFTLSLVLIAALGAISLLKRGSREQKIFIISTLIYSLSYPLAFPNATFIHNYFIFYLILPLALLTSFGLSSFFKSKLVWAAFSLVLILAVWVERDDFLRALEVSSQDRLAVEIGKELAQKIDEKDLVLVTPYSFAVSRYPHLAFYSDRKITAEPNSSYNWLVEVNEKDGSYKILFNKR